MHAMVLSMLMRRLESFVLTINLLWISLQTRFLKWRARAAVKASPSTKLIHRKWKIMVSLHEEGHTR